jgi:hypothetical protein
MAAPAPQEMMHMAPAMQSLSLPAKQEDAEDDVDKSEKKKKKKMKAKEVTGDDEAADHSHAPEASPPSQVVLVQPKVAAGGS